MVWKIEDKNISAEHFYRVGGILVKAFRTGHYFLALFFTGFLTGILIVNYIWGRTAKSDRNFYRSLSYEIKE